jgi:hypothetical protein
MKQYLTPGAYTNMCEILDSIRTKVKRIVRVAQLYICPFGSDRAVSVKRQVNPPGTTRDERCPMTKSTLPGK